MEVKWIKIVPNMFDDEKVLLIETLPEADAIIVIWFKLLCMAGKQNNNGIFMLNDKIAYTEEMLATIFRRPINIVRLALKTFKEFGMIEIIEGVITIPNWEKHQNIDGLDKIKKQTRERVARHRAKQKLLIEGSKGCNVTSSVSVTECNAIEKEEEKEKNKKDKFDKKDKPLSSDFPLNNITKQLIKRNFICEGDLDLFNYDNFFCELLLTYEYETICKVVNYVMARMKTNENIENKFGYFKTSVLQNINNIEALKEMEDDPFNWLNW